MTYVTRFSCDIFGFYVAFIYLQKGIQVLTRQWEAPSTETAAYLSITISLLVLGSAYACGIIGASNLFQRRVRKFIEDYGTPLTIIFFTGFIHIGRMKTVELSTLPTSRAFFPTQDRDWLIHFWRDIDVSDIFVAIPFAILLTILFYFDHNVSSLIAQGTEFPLRKPAGFHWDIFLLGLTTGVAGILGIPFPNGLIPQAPFHTQALCVYRQSPTSSKEAESTASKGHTTRTVDHVVEQRVSNLSQGLLTLGTMSGPLLIVLHLIPQGVLAGLFFVMGVQALESNGITLKLLFLLRDADSASTSPSPSSPLKSIDRPGAIWAFVAFQLFGFAVTFAITQTVAAIGFPVFILLLVPVRTFVLPRWFRPQELKVLDRPTASRFVMESVGGAYGESEEGDGDGDGGGYAASASASVSSSPFTGRTGSGGAATVVGGNVIPDNDSNPAAGKAALERGDVEIDMQNLSPRSPPLPLPPPTKAVAGGEAGAGSRNRTVGRGTGTAGQRQSVGAGAGAGGGSSAGKKGKSVSLEAERR